MAETLFTEEDFRRRAAIPAEDGGDGALDAVTKEAIRLFEEAGGASEEFWDNYRQELDVYVSQAADKLIYGE